MKRVVMKDHIQNMGPIVNSAQIDSTLFLYQGGNDPALYYTTVITLVFFF